MGPILNLYIPSPVSNLNAPNPGVEKNPLEAEIDPLIFNISSDEFKLSPCNLNIPFSDL